MAAKADVQIVGLDELARGNLKLAGRIEDASGQALEGAAEQVASAGAARVPRRTGRMAASITTGQTVGGATVGYDGSAPYAGWVEFGGTRGRSYVPGGRYLFPVAMNAEPLLQAAGEMAARREIGVFRWPTPR